MKRIINGRRFDTDKATAIAERSGGNGRRDFRFYEETLYRTPRGIWFLHGRGGPMTRWAEPVSDGCRTGGENIHALTPEQALQWLEDADEIDAIEEHFADVIEDA